jgi:hypothetical protein
MAMPIILLKRAFVPSKSSRNPAGFTRKMVMRFYKRDNCKPALPASNATVPFLDRSPRSFSQTMQFGSLT